MGFEIRVAAQPELAFVKLLTKLISPGNRWRARLKLPCNAEFIQKLRTNLTDKFNFNHKKVLKYKLVSGHAIQSN